MAARKKKKRPAFQNDALSSVKSGRPSSKPDVPSRRVADSLQPVPSPEQRFGRLAAKARLDKEKLFRRAVETIEKQPRGKSHLLDAEKMLFNWADEDLKRHREVRGRRAKLKKKKRRSRKK
jgi:hypothetical protein